MLCCFWSRLDLCLPTSNAFDNTLMIWYGFLRSFHCTPEDLAARCSMRDVSKDFGLAACAGIAILSQYFETFINTITYWKVLVSALWPNRKECGSVVNYQVQWLVTTASVIFQSLIQYEINDVRLDTAATGLIYFFFRRLVFLQSRDSCLTHVETK